MKRKLLRWLRYALIVLVVVFIAIQFVPVDRTNPPVTMDIDAPANVKAVLRRSCYDCHSNETNWRWYSYIAPVSWLVADDVDHGRSHMNFSTWDRYSPSDQRHLLEEALEEVEHGSMPLASYLFMHGQAELTEDDRRILAVWVKQSE